MMDLILGAIPLWVWIGVGLLIAAPVLYFLGPIWNGLPNWIKYPVYAVVSFLGFSILAKAISLPRAARKR